MVDVTGGKGKGRALAQASGWLIAVLAIVVGNVLALFALGLAAAATGVRWGAFIVGVLVLLSSSWWLARSAAQRITTQLLTRRWLTVGVTSASLVVLAILWGSLFITPAPAHLPYADADGVQYWELATGSPLAYAHTPAADSAAPTPVILVHGGPGSPSRDQGDLVAALSEAGFDVYDYHQLGAGLSARLRDVSQYTVERHVQDLEAIRQTISAEHVVLIGSSWGAQLIAKYMAAYPERVARAVTSSPGTIWAPAFDDESRLTPGGKEDLDGRLASHPRFMLAHVLLQTIGPKGASTLLPDEQMDGVFQEFVGSLNMWAGCPGTDTQEPSSGRSPSGIGFWVNAVTTYHAQQSIDPRPALREVQAPLLVLRGECDYIAWEVAREYRDIFPNALLLAVDNAGHTLAADRPDLYQDAVVSFLLGEDLPQRAYTADRSPW